MLLLGAVGNVCWLFFSGFSGVHLSYQTGRIWHLGIASFCVFAFALGWSYFGKHLLHENWSLELRLLTQLSKISTSHQNRSHYDMKPSSSGLKRFLVIRKKNGRVSHEKICEHLFHEIFKLDSLSKNMSQNAAGLVKQKKWLWLLSSEMIAMARLLKKNDIDSTRDMLKTIPSLNDQLNH